MAIVTDFIPGTDGKVRAAIIRLRLGKETTRSIQTIYPLEVQADIDMPVDDAEVCTVEKATSTRKKNPLRKKNLESFQEAGDSGREDVADCQRPLNGGTSRFGRSIRRPVIFYL